jgi:hypothetical protein
MQTALITGASSGIGAAFADELAKQQTNLVLVARSEDKLNQLADRLRQIAPIQVEVLVADLTQTGANQAIFDRVSQKGLTIDLLINNAGFGDYGAFSDRPLAKQLEMIQLNVLALVELTYLFLPGMKSQGSGSIINVGSIAGFQPLPYMSVYAATKAFVLSFTEALWAENRQFGIRVQALCPGPTSTNFPNVAEFPNSMNFSGPQKLATPEEVVLQSLEALAKNESTVVTGGLGNQLIVNIPRFLPRDTLVSAIEKQFKFS